MYTPYFSADQNIIKQLLAVALLSADPATVDRLSRGVKAIGDRRVG